MLDKLKRDITVMIIAMENTRERQRMVILRANTLELAFAAGLRLFFKEFFSGTPVMYLSFFRCFLTNLIIT
jgi:hypothetical protein